MEREEAKKREVGKEKIEVRREERSGEEGKWKERK